MAVKQVNISRLTGFARHRAIDEAKDSVRHRLVAPSIDEFKLQSVSTLPVWFTSLVLVLLLVVVLAGANISIIRVYEAGAARHSQFGSSPEWQSKLIGVSTFVLAEFMVIVSTLAATTLFEGKQRRIMVVPVILGLLMAVLGNWVVAAPRLSGWTVVSLWEITDTLVPPMSLIFMAMILERILTDAVRMRFEMVTRFNEALLSYKLMIKDPSKHEEYKYELANSLKLAILKANKRGKSSEDKMRYLNSLSGQGWRELVLREMDPGHWMDVKETPSVPAAPEYTADDLILNHPEMLPNILRIKLNLNGDMKEYTTYLESVKSLLPDKVTSRRLRNLEKKCAVMTAKMGYESTVRFAVEGGALIQRAVGPIPKELTLS